MVQCVRTRVEGPCNTTGALPNCVARTQIIGTVPSKSEDLDVGLRQSSAASVPAQLRTSRPTVVRRGRSHVCCRQHLCQTMESRRVGYELETESNKSGYKYVHFCKIGHFHLNKALNGESKQMYLGVFTTAETKWNPQWRLSGLGVISPHDADMNHCPS